MNDVCEFCRNDGWSENENLINPSSHLSSKGDFYSGFTVYVDGDSLSIRAVADTYEPSYMEDEIKINFCPMCGRKL